MIISYGTGNREELSFHLLVNKRCISKITNWALHGNKTVDTFIFPIVIPLYFEPYKTHIAVGTILGNENVQKWNSNTIIENCKLCLSTSSYNTQFTTHNKLLRNLYLLF